MNIKRFSLSATALIAAAGVGYLFSLWYTSQLPPWLQSAENQNNPEIATINGTSIYKSDLIPYLQEQVDRRQLIQWGRLEAIPPNVYKTALLNLAEDVLVRDLADKASLTDRPEVKALMAKSNNRIAKLTFLDSLAPQLVDEQEVKQRYTELANSLEGKTEYHARHILLKDKKEANIVMKALKKRPFEELAKLFSLDEKTGIRGGDLGYVLPGSLDPEFEKAVSKLKIGQTSKPFKTKFGWHIARLEDRRKAKPMDYEQARPIIRQQLERQAIRNWLDELVSNADIQTKIAVKEVEEPQQEKPGTHQQSQNN